MWLAVLVTLLAYSGIGNNDFINLDDHPYILNNTVIRHLDLSNLKNLLTATLSGNWIPLTTLSLALDYQLGHLEPWVYHLHNLLLHCLNTALVFFLSYKLLNLIKERANSKLETEAVDWVAPAAFGTALLFGLHPLHVESVAWAAERRDVLCGFFYLLSLWFYLDYASQSVSRWWKYGASLGFCVLALLSKPMAVSLPLVMLLLDVWPLGRFQSNPQKTILEKIPFLIVGIATSWVTVVLQNRVGVIPSLNQLPMSYRFMNACHSVLFYLWKMAAPVHLAAHYPIMIEDINSTGFAVSVLLVILISTLCFLLRKKRPYFLAAWLYFGITLGPVLGLIQVGYQAAGDRFTYLPSLGPFMLLAALLSGLLSKRPRILIALAVIVSGLLGYGTYRQVDIWRNSITLLENVLRVNPGKTMLVIDNNLGAAYEEAGRLDDALAEFDRVLYLKIRVPNPYYERGKIFLEKGRLDDAVLELRKALVLSRFNPSFHDELGLVFLKMGMPPAALDEAKEAQRSNPKHAMTQDTLGLIYMSLGRFDEAVTAFKEARDLEPENSSYFNHLIGAYQKVGNYRECLALYQELSKD